MKNFIEDVVTIEISGNAGVFSESYKVIAPKDFFDRLAKIMPNGVRKVLRYQSECLNNEVSEGYSLPKDFKPVVCVPILEEDEEMKRAAKIMNDAMANIDWSKVKNHPYYGEIYGVRIIGKCDDASCCK